MDMIIVKSTEVVKNLPDGTHTFVVVGPNSWGKGKTFNEARNNFGKNYGRMVDGFVVYCFGEGSSFEGVNDMGDLRYGGPEPIRLAVRGTQTTF